MAAPTIVNKFGRLMGWNSITFNFFGRDIEGILEFAYDDSVDVESIYGANKMPIGYGEGNYAATAGLTVTAEEWRAMLEALPAGQRIQDAVGEIVCRYEYGTKFYTDIVQNVVIKKHGVGPKQGDKSIGVKLELHTSHIDWNVA
jgi:hypothetical protein